MDEHAANPETRRVSHDTAAHPAPQSMRYVWLVSALAASWCVDGLSRVAYHLDYIPELGRDALGMVSLLILALPTVYILFLIKKVPALYVTLMLAIVLGLLGQLSDMVDELAFAQAYPLLAKTSVLHLEIERMIFLTGGLFALATTYFAIVFGDEDRQELHAEQKLLAQNIREREEAEAALRKAHDELELVVEERTQELRERNEQLGIELRERERFEVSLASRLRYEEGLAACSQILLADSEPDEALNRALTHLLVVTEASRVYLFENRADTERGLCAVLTHESWEVDHCPDCVRSVGLTIAYADGLERWREEMSVGNFVVGINDAFSGEERTLLDHHNIQSLLLLPLGWEGRWRGFLGFDDVTRQRVWGHEEIRVLRTACEMVGACKERQRAEQQLLTAYDDLERRVEERTRDLKVANDQLQKEAADRRRAEEDKVQLESELRQAQKIQAIGTLAGGIAHDFNNILASILGYTELALSRMEEDNRYRRYFNEVLKASNRARELVQQILIFSRQSEAEKRPVFPHLIADEIVALLSASCPVNISIRSNINTGTGAVLSSTVQMHQVILNLCTNAQHAMRKNGGVLEVCVQPRTLAEPLKTPIAELAPGNYCYLSVRDTGEGIPALTLERIFDPFFTTKSVHEGTGMGLAIVHGIVTGQGGAVLVDSIPGKYTLFEVYLPRHDGPVVADVSETLVSPEGEERILVVDDEPQLVQLWTELLEQYGYHVRGFSDSLQALEHFREHQQDYDFVLLDQNMPHMTGTELSRNFLRERADLPIVIATGFSESVSPEVIREIGIRDLVYKPILGRDLTMAIRRVLDQPRHRLETEST